MSMNVLSRSSYMLISSCLQAAVELKKAFPSNLLRIESIFRVFEPLDNLREK